MNRGPVCVRADANVLEAARLLAATEVSDLMVVGDGDTFVGVLSEGDLLRAVLPDRDEVMALGGSVNDGFAVFERKARELTLRPIHPYVITEPLTLRPDEHLATAAAALVDRQIRRLPVVDRGRLVGTASRADICRAVLGGLATG
jgi:CBS domain-containing protein